jgi:hypothetical protein
MTLLTLTADLCLGSKDSNITLEDTDRPFDFTLSPVNVFTPDTFRFFCFPDPSPLGAHVFCAAAPQQPASFSLSFVDRSRH